MSFGVLGGRAFWVHGAMAEQEPPEDEGARRPGRRSVRDARARSGAPSPRAGRAARRPAGQRETPRALAAEEFPMPPRRPHATRRWPTAGLAGIGGCGWPLRRSAGAALLRALPGAEAPAPAPKPLTPAVRGGGRSVTPRATSAANPTVSDSVGCGWMVSAMSSASAPISSAWTTSAISSPAPDADDPGPEHPLGLGLDQELGQSVGAPERQRAARGRPGERRPSRSRRPARAPSSVSPIQATSGSV